MPRAEGGRENYQKRPGPLTGVPDSGILQAVTLLNNRKFKKNYCRMQVGLW